MEERKQHMAGLSDQSAQREDPGAKGDMQTYMGITENSLTAIGKEVDSLLEYILSLSNLNQTYKQVRRNRGSGGMDKMEVEELLPYLRQHKKGQPQ
jgi:hypothetical protein